MSAVASASWKPQPQRAVEPTPTERASTLAARVRGPAPALALLARVGTCDTLAQALRRRRKLAPGESVVTPSGEWVGRNWLRLRRGSDAHTGVLERAQRLKELTRACATAEAAVQAGEQAPPRCARRCRTRNARAMGAAPAAGRTPRSRRIACPAGRLQVRVDEAQLRRQRLEADRDEVAAELARTVEDLAQARQAHGAALEVLQRLDASLPALTDEREMYRERAATARTTAQAAELALRDMLVRHEAGAPRMNPWSARRPGCSSSAPS